MPNAFVVCSRRMVAGSKPLIRRGSEWHRWDPHLHAPDTLLSDQFSGDWEGYLTAIETAEPVVRALGVTDYFCIRTYQRVREQKERHGRLPRVDLLFPNVEMRLTLETERRRGINLHLLFSPEDADHEQQIDRILGLLRFEYQQSTYSCRLDEFARLGRAVDPGQLEREGAIRTGVNQFKVDLQQLKDLFRSEAWLDRNCLVAVAAAEGDGTSGLQADASFKALREEIEAFAHVIFSGKPTDRAFWLGKKAGCDAAWIERTYGALKPCLHGSDAHRKERVLAPDKERSCWIKAELTFDGLRQAVLDPEERVAIGQETPDAGAEHERLAGVSVLEAPWFGNERIDLNRGLVAIIGARGSGKTALADILAQTTGASSAADTSDASFLRRASRPANLLGRARARIEWADGESSEVSLSTDPGELDQEPRVRYLSQQFVERLCSAEGLAADLVREIEAVVFKATDETERLGAADFAELKDHHVEGSERIQAEHRAAIERISMEIAAEDDAHERVPSLKERRKVLSAKIEACAKELEQLAPKGKDERTARLNQLETACTEAETQVQQAKLARQRVEELRAEVQRTRSVSIPNALADLRRRFSAVGIGQRDWEHFGLRFVGDVDAILTGRAADLDRDVRLRMEGSREHPVDVKREPRSDWPVDVLRQQRDELKREVNIDATKARRLADITRTVAQLNVELKKLDEQIAADVAFKDRRENLVQQRRDAYSDVFDEFRRQQELLEGLYAPLRRHLDRAGGAPSKLAFVVRRRVDLDRWVRDGEQLLDLRAAGDLRGRGSLKRAALAELEPAWRSGGAEEAARSLQVFLLKHWADIRAGRPASVDAAEMPAWLEDVGRWLFSTEHIRLEYGLLYDGVEIERLSPGTRGIVLLTLYLVVDEWDPRPLLIDQPEENLDPKSVFDELVAYFRAARHRRQVILVTHNANLVVNTDADQVIVAEATRNSPTGLPQLTYRTGGLEDPNIRRDVCALLEGGERAFLERERRYRFAGDPRGR